LRIKIFYENTPFRIKEWRKFKSVIEKVIRKEKRVSGDLNFIITDDVSLRKINVQFLEHDYDTDVITFNYNEGNIVNGEIYCSLETVKDNARNYKVSLNNEIKRVLIHGVLHLVGYDDKGSDDKRKMKFMEEFWLKEI
jgi:probable rRNA maturation factor